MKWTNRGHELDAVAEQFLAVKTIYIWGTGVNGTMCIDFLEWLKIDTDFNIFFVNSKPEKQGGMYRGHPVVPPEELFAHYDETCIIASSNKEISGILKEHGLPYFGLEQVLCGRNVFIQYFLCIYMLYKYDILLSHWLDYNATIRCTLNCQGCLNFNNDIKDPRDETLDAFRKHIDTVFQKVDLCYSMHFSGGEAFLAKELPGMLKYFTDNYGAKTFDRFVVTSGTVIPSDELLTALKEGDYWVVIDDYRDTVPASRKLIPQIEEKLASRGIRYQVNCADSWYDQEHGTKKYASYSDEALIAHRDSCNTFLQNCADGRFYSCCYEAYAYKAGVEPDADHIDILSSSKKEILEYRLGYTEKGYVDMCRHCRGVGPDTKYIKPAVQIPRKYK